MKPANIEDLTGISNLFLCCHPQTLYAKFFRKYVFGMGYMPNMTMHKGPDKMKKLSASERRVNYTNGPYGLGEEENDRIIGMDIKFTLL
uniref:Uncharacterized protein n=1 Tax=Lactuca sativa TaxID=4236 RepID=A0A9R1VS82_LACSA|nr:hypothetical protein LSAT_V11C400205020 [Lactuca sativa]